MQKMKKRVKRYTESDYSMQLGLWNHDEEFLEKMKEHFTEAEYNRLADKFFYVLRDRNIRSNFKAYRRQGLKYDEAIRALSRDFALSESQISHIVYPRKNKRKY